MLKILKKREEKPERKEEAIEADLLQAEQIEDVGEAVIVEPNSSDEIGKIEETETVEELPQEEKKPEGVTRGFRQEAESFAKGKELPAERLEAGIEMLKKIGEAWRTGELTVELLDVALRGIDYDDAVAKAFADGELKGRNTQIEEKYMRPEDSDGLPHPSGKGSASRSARRVASIFDLARDAG